MYPKKSETLRRERPRLIKFHQFGQVKNDDFLPANLFDFEKKLRHWHPNGAPRSGDRVDVFRVEERKLTVFLRKSEIVIEVTFQVELDVEKKTLSYYKSLNSH